MPFVYCKRRACGKNKNGFIEATSTNVYNRAMTLREFEDLVRQALDGLPDQFAKALNNVEVVVEVWPSGKDLRSAGVGPGVSLFGLYRGIPQTKRGTYYGALPDKISIFAGPIVQAVGDNPEMVKKQVRKTVLHEIGHHFGMTEEQIHEILSASCSSRRRVSAETLYRESAPP